MERETLRKYIHKQTEEQDSNDLEDNFKITSILLIMLKVFFYFNIKKRPDFCQKKGLWLKVTCFKITIAS